MNRYYLDWLQYEEIPRGAYLIEIYPDDYWCLPLRVPVELMVSTPDNLGVVFYRHRVEAKGYAGSIMESL